VPDPAETRLALFDLDGTLTRADTLFAFVRAVRGPIAYGLGLVALSPWLVAHKLGMLAAEPTKVRFLRWFLGGMRRDALAAHGSAFADRLEALLRPEAKARLAWHQDQGHEVLVVTASLDLWVRPWAERRGLGLLSTEAAFDGDVFRGALATPNCNGPEKERRIRERLDPDAYAWIYGYGDSAGDAEMLSLADELWLKSWDFDPATPAGRAATGT
jgi:phosphatidylglycerophosphatase C